MEKNLWELAHPTINCFIVTLYSKNVPVHWIDDLRSLKSVNCVEIFLMKEYLPISMFLYMFLQVTVQTLDEKLGRMVTRVVLPRVVMHSRHHYGVSCN